jgi:EmrB/QacA subfamily drug resistance transporter
MTKQQKLVVLISILASFVAFLDGSVINVALPAITRDLHGSFAVQQWVVDAYLLSLGSLILIAGSLSDLFGRKRILSAGLIGFGAASILCAVAPNSGLLIFARLLQGVAGALLVPSSLALIMSAFKGSAQGKAIGTWTAWTGIAFLVGPLLGGSLVDAGSWRYIFAINLIPIGITLWLMRRLKQKEVIHSNTKVDFTGAIIGALGLGGPAYAFIEQPNQGWGSPAVFLPLIFGVLAFAAFIVYEMRAPNPMLPLSLFKQRNFLVGNIATTAIYAGLSVATFLLAVFVQQVGGYSALEAGLALMPVTIIMFFLSSRFGALSGRYGPRFFMAVGPIVGGIGFLTMLRIDASVDYLGVLLPGILLFGLGLSMTVAPLTTAVLSAVPVEESGIASAVNNAVSRVAGLAAIAAVGIVIGSQVDVAGFRQSILFMSGLLIAGGIVSAIGIQNPQRLAHLSKRVKE